MIGSREIGLALRASAVAWNVASTRGIDDGTSTYSTRNTAVPERRREDRQRATKLGREACKELRVRGRGGCTIRNLSEHPFGGHLGITEVQQRKRMHSNHAWIPARISHGWMDLLSTLCSELMRINNVELADLRRRGRIGSLGPKIQSTKMLESTTVRDV